MTATTAEALEAALPKITKTTVVFHAYHEDADDGDIDELYTDLDLAKQHTAAVYAYEEYGHALISDGALAWEPLGNGWKLVDQDANTGIVIAERHMFKAKGDASVEPTVSFRELLAANPDTIGDDTEILITAGELRERLDELGRLRAQAEKDVLTVAWYLHTDDRPYEERLAVLCNHFDSRAQAALDAIRSRTAGAQ